MNSLDVRTSVWNLTLALFAVYVVAMLPETSLAQGAGADTEMGEVLCTVVDWFTGNLGQGIATLAIIVIGVGALMGKVSWGMAIIVGIGVAVIFGAGAIVEQLGARGTGCGASV